MLPRAARSATAGGLLEPEHFACTNRSLLREAFEDGDNASGAGAARSGAAASALSLLARARGVRAAALLGLAALACILVAMPRRPLSRGLRHTDVRASVGLQAVAGQAPLQYPSAASVQPQTATQVTAAKQRNPGWDPSYWDRLAEGRKVGGALSPSENLNDGNTCMDDEEPNGGLCYKKCSILTDNEYPIRTTAFTCCKATPCHPFNSRKDMGLCSGFDVGGGPGNNCPHMPGGCLTDEEMHLGRCFKKCSILTNGEFTHRVAPVACCKVPRSYRCLYPSNIRVSRDFNTGGGAGDGDSSTPASSHTPMPQLTESSPA